MLGMVGVDLVFIPEFQAQLDIDKTAFIDKAFNLPEISSLEIGHLAGLWAAKEAVYKAAKVAPKSLKDIIITHSKTGKASARIGQQKFALSVSHHGDYAVAVAYRMSE